MKKRGLVGIILIAVLCNLVFVSAVACNPTVSLINQDPYPAIPGEYVKLVFQVSGVENPDCTGLYFELIEQYPISFDPGTGSIVYFDAGFFNRDYSSFLIAPYKVKIDKDAIEGDNPIDTKLTISKTGVSFRKQFNLYVEDSNADFEVHIDKYSYATQEIVLEILNIANTDVEALTLEIPKQDNIEVKGANRVVVGDLDSNEYTTADFKGALKDGEIDVKILYTDQTGIRRELTKTILYDSAYFADTQVDGTSTSIIYTIIILVVLALIIWWYFGRKKRKARLRKMGKARL
ncbi:MAG: LPXTG cell wall anchor domain-containing protein [archaeon]